jgi:hypothetical protein
MVYSFVCVSEGQLTRALADSGLAPAEDHVALGRIWHARLSQARRRMAEI